LIVTTIKVYGNIRSNSFSGNYTPCSSRTKQGTDVIETTILCWDEIALRVGEVYWSSKRQDQD